MPQPQPFVRHLARLVWLLVHRPSSLDEQKDALRHALAEGLTRSHEVVLVNVNMAIAEATRVQPIPEELTWLSELAMRMAGHSVRTIAFEAGTTANDVLGLARALVTPASPGDDGAALDRRLVALVLTTVNVHFGREGFVRRATPHGMATVTGPARTPAAGMLAISPAAPNAGVGTSPLRIPTPPPALLPKTMFATAPGALSTSTDEEAAGGQPRENFKDDTHRMIASTFVRPAGSSRELEQLFERLEHELTQDSAPRLLEEVARSAESHASEGLWVDVVDIMRRLHARDLAEKDPDVKRAILVALRRLSKPGILRGIAQLLPRRRELRDDVTTLIASAGDVGSDVLIDLLVTTDSTSERSAYRAALSHCESAVPALVHLLGDSRWYVVRNAAELLGEMAVEEADAKLAATLKHPDARVRRAAAVALGRIGSTRAVHALQQSLGDREAAVRLAVAAALGHLKNPRAVPALIDALDEEADVEVQGAILQALGAMPTADGVERLARAAEPGSVLHRRPAAQRLVAIQALAEAGTPAAHAALRKLAGDRDREVRDRVAKLLAEKKVG